MSHRIDIARPDWFARERGRVDVAPGVRQEQAGAVVRLSPEARRLLANGEPAVQPVAPGAPDGEGTAVSLAGVAAIDVEFRPVRQARERVAPARIVPAESLQSETVTPVVWLRVAESDGAHPPHSPATPGPQIARQAAATSWIKSDVLEGHAGDPVVDPRPDPAVDAAVDFADLAAAVLVSLDSARRAAYGGFDHAHRAGECAVCRRAVAAYR